jgi:DNA primase
LNIPDEEVGMLDKIIDSCKYLLNNFPEAQDCQTYLDSRLSRKSQELFQFGYFPDPSNLQVLLDMVGEDILQKTKLLYSKDIEDSLCFRKVNVSFFEHHPLIMPFKDSYGKVVALVGRTLLSEDDMKSHKTSKYKNTVFKKRNHLFGLFENKQHILDQNAVYIVEGQFDVIKAVERGFKNIVALGSNNMSSYQFSVISRYTDNIFLLLDNDEGGKKGRKLIIDKFGKFANIQNFYLPKHYKDIDEYFSKSGDESVSFSVEG